MLEKAKLLFLTTLITTESKEETSKSLCGHSTGLNVRLYTTAESAGQAVLWVLFKP